MASISQKQAERQLQKIYQKGWTDCRNEILRIVYAAVVKALSENLGLTRSEIVETLKRINDISSECIDSSELIDQILNYVGIELKLEDPLEPIRETR